MPRLLLRRSLRGLGVHVMVTHSPPTGIHDIPTDYAHRGFGSLLFLIAVGRPEYLIHGHVDTWDNRKTRKSVFRGTTVLNINPVMVVDLNSSRSGFRLPGSTFSAFIGGNATITAGQRAVSPGICRELVMRTMWQNYYSVTTVGEALDLLAQYGERARIVAGATDLISSLSAVSVPVSIH